MFPSVHQRDATEKFAGSTLQRERGSNGYVPGYIFNGKYFAIQHRRGIDSAQLSYASLWSLFIHRFEEVSSKVADKISRKRIMHK